MFYIDLNHTTSKGKTYKNVSGRKELWAHFIKPNYPVDEFRLHCRNCITCHFKRCLWVCTLFFPVVYCCISNYPLSKHSGLKRLAISRETKWLFPRHVKHLPYSDIWSWELIQFLLLHTKCVAPSSLRSSLVLDIGCDRIWVVSS